uniref:ORF120 n=2 Tax=Leptospirillum ferrooxidans TaxID=180 RepID=Q58KC1_9BACT|nr:ORF120 [Leptospirillum ferrooxidans]
MIDFALAHPSASGEGALSGRGPGMDLEMLKTAIGQERSEYEETQRELAEMGLLPDSPNGSGISREITMFQLETLTKTYELLRKISLDLPESVIEQNADRVKVAEKNAAEILKTLNMGERK